MIKQLIRNLNSKQPYKKNYRNKKMTITTLKKDRTKQIIKSALVNKLLTLGLILIMLLISLPKAALAQLFEDNDQQSISGVPNASISLPNTEYTESVIDLRVKVLGGEVTLNRTWINGRWYINPAWANLRFVIDPLDNSVKTIDRAGTLYQRTGNTDLYNFDQVYIKKLDNGWRWYDREGNWIIYDTDGRITEYGDRNNIKVTFELDSQGRRTVIKDHHGELVYSFTYDSNELLTQVEDREGNTVSYQWQSNKLTKVTDVLGNEWLYGYDGNGQLNQKTEPDGGVIKIDYTDSVPAPKTAMNSAKNKLQDEVTGIVSTGVKDKDTKIARVGKITDKTGAVTIYNTQYSRTNKQYTITVDEPIGKKTVSTFDADGQMLARVTNNDMTETFIRDTKNKVLKYQDERGLTTTVQYNQANQPIKIIYPDGASEDYSYDKNFGQMVSYTNKLGVITTQDYDAKGNLIKLVEAVGKPEQNTTSWTYDIYGQADSITYEEGNNISTASYEYDNQGNISSFTDGKGYTYQYNYNIMGQKTVTTNPLNASWVNTYNQAGVILQTQDPLNHITNYEADFSGRIKKITDPLGNETQYTYSFNSDGLEITQIDPLNQVTKRYYNSSGNMIKKVSSSGLVIEQSYDELGRITQYTDTGNGTLFEYGNENNSLKGLLVKVIQPILVKTYKYNALGLRTEIKEILNDQETLTTTVSYDRQGNPISITDPAKRTDLLQYNAYDKQTEHIDPLGNKTVLTWNSLGKITRVVDANGKTYNFEYDQNNNPIKKAKALGNDVVYRYDEANQLIEEQDASGNITSYQYDLAGRLINKEYSKQSQDNVEQTVSYRYDDADQLLEVTQVGDTQSNFAYTRDSLGRITQEVISYGEGSNKITKTLQYTYTAEGDLASITYPNNSTVTFDYQNGQLKQTTLPNGEEVTWDNYQWKKPTEVNFPNAIQLYQYDALQRPLSIKVQVNNQLLMERDYQYDKVGNVIQIDTEQGDNVYQYDLLDRLTSVMPDKALQQQGLPVEGYSYDAIGNRTGSINQLSDWVYNDKNQLTQWSKDNQLTDLTYTANGHIAVEASINQQLAYSYNVADRLTTITKDGTAIANYQYDPFGRRITKTTNGITTYYIYSKEGLLAELDQQGNLQVAYGWQPNTEFGTSPLWQANVKNNDLTISIYNYFHTDHLGTVQLATNSQGQISWQGVSDAFGKTTFNTNNQITMNLRFPGQYFDQETGLHYNYHRIYDSQSGRYMQADPIGLEGGWNVYSYVGGNPVNAMDTLGLKRMSSRDLDSCRKRLGPGPGNTPCHERENQQQCAECCGVANFMARITITACQAECVWWCQDGPCDNYKGPQNSL